MEFMTSAILGGITYDILKTRLTISKHTLKERLTNWLIDDRIIESLAVELNQIDLNDEQSEKAIQREIESSEHLLKLIQTIQPVQTIISQNHSGQGDNIAGNKIINN